MRPAATALLSGGAGCIVGAVAYGWFAAHSLDSWNRVVRIRFAIEQEHRAARAERQGDLLAALHHRWNVVEAQSPAWLRMFETWEAPAPWFPLQFAIVGKVIQETDPEHKGVRVVDLGIARGQLARLLEANGQMERAAHQWKAAAELAGGSDAQRTRELVASLHTQEATALHRQAEEAVLGPVRVEP